jgi:PRTRC genetic system protein B
MTVHGFSGEGDATQFDLVKAILFYTAGGAGQLATVHDVRTATGGRPEICPGSPLTRVALEEIAQFVTREAEDGRPSLRQILPEHLLYSDATTLLWWKPAHVAPIFFRTGRKDFDEKVNGKLVSHPPLLFLATSGHLSLWALGENVRPGESSMLFQAPYFNVYNTGSMCTGNVRLPDILRPAAMGGFEEGFFSTNFTHSNTDKSPLTSFPGGHDALWRHLAENGEAFPMEALIPATRPATLHEALNQRRGQ